MGYLMHDFESLVQLCSPESKAMKDYFQPHWHHLVTVTDPSGTELNISGPLHACLEYLTPLSEDIGNLEQEDKNKIYNKIIQTYLNLVAQSDHPFDSDSKQINTVLKTLDKQNSSTSLDALRTELNNDTLINELDYLLSHINDKSPLPIELKHFKDSRRNTTLQYIRNFFNAKFDQAIKDNAISKSVLQKLNHQTNEHIDIYIKEQFLNDEKLPQHVFNANNNAYHRGMAYMYHFFCKDITQKTKNSNDETFTAHLYTYSRFMPTSLHLCSRMQ